jgi:clan AA aspartic protease (TIGR02281 family)
MGGTDMLRFAYRLGIWTLVTCFALSTTAMADVYRWTSDDGSLSFSNLRHRAPRELRSTLVLIPSDLESVYLAAATGRDSSGDSEFVVPFQQMGSLIKVSVRLNEQVTAPFYLDTAASSVVIPTSIAAALDLEPGSISKTIYARTANGRVPMSVTKLASVDLRGASVKNVDCLISDQLEVGLLGASFLRHFKYTVDSASQTVVFEPLSLAGGTASLALTR